MFMSLTQYISFREWIQSRAAEAGSYCQSPGFHPDMDFLYQVLAPHHPFPRPLATSFPLSHSKPITKSWGCSCPPPSSPKFSHFPGPTAFFSIQANTYSRLEGHISQRSCPLSTLQLEEGSLQRFLLFPG